MCPSFFIGVSEGFYIPKNPGADSIMRYTDKSVNMPI